jgi:hypothetical protein
MKKLIILLITVTASFATFAQTGKDTIPKSKSDTTMQVEYYCGMHPDVISDEPGKCPKCGMELLERKIEAKKLYVCPMHPDVKSDKHGKCSKCGMDLVEKKPAKAKSKKGGS